MSCSDKEKRAAYDALADRVARGGSPRRFQPPPGWDEGFEFHRGPHAGRPTMPTSASSSPRCSASGRAAPARGRANCRSRGEDHHAAIEISLEDALHGAEREISLRAQGSTRRAAAVRDPHARRAHPARRAPGQYIRLAGQGLPGHGGEPAGDLYLEVRIAPHKLYRIEARPLHDAARHADRSALGAQVTCRRRTAAWSTSPCRQARAAA
jgi:curved DNA-binding protein